MRFISRYTEFQFGAVADVYEIHPDGRMRITKPGFIVEFHPHDATAYERQMAKERFQWGGTVRSEAGRELDPVDDQHRVSSFDTATIPDEALRAKVEESLFSHSDYGIDFILVEPPTVQPPYEKYDAHRKVTAKHTLDHVLKDIETAYDAVGFDLDQARSYELANGADPTVLAAFEALRPQPAPEEELVQA